MKKLLSTFMALSMLTSFSVCPAYAESDNELSKLASSLGADTDYFAVPNQFYSRSINADSIIGYEYMNCIPTDTYIPTVTGMGAYADTSFSLSVMEVLAHNGLISASDIKAGTDSLNQINNVSDIQNLIIDYQNLFNKHEFELYRNYIFKSTSAEEKVDILCSTAEKCMKEGKYFLIMYGSCCTTPSELSKGDSSVITVNARKEHSAVGMGITDGSWTYNGKTYDKCILTLDSLSADENSSAFAEDTCIYVNSETKECYIPKISDYAESDMHIAVIDDDKLLNFGGAINPTDSFDTDLSDVYFIQCMKKNHIHQFTYTDDNGNETVINKEVAVGDEETKDNYPNISGLSLKSDNFTSHILSCNQMDFVDIKSINSWMSFSFAGADSELHVSNDEVYKFVKKEHAADDTTHDENDPLEYSAIYSKEYTERDVVYDFKGETMDEAEFKVLDDGVIFSGGSVIFYAYSGNPYDGNLLSSIAFTSSGEVFVQYDETNGFKIKTDLDNDGVFEHEVEKGDVNCDGLIDSVDAAAVLQTYADLSTQREIHPDTIYAGNELSDFNSDGFIDSVDASNILEKYAELSTT